MSRFENGYFKYWRKAAFNDIASRNFETLWVFTRLLAMANLKEAEVMRGGKLVKVSPGQIVTSLEELSFYGSVDMQKVRRALRYLEKRQTIKQSSDNRGRIITICNWDRYQTSQLESDKQTSGKRQASDIPVTSKRQRIEELKNIRIQEGEVANFPEDLNFQNILHPAQHQEISLKYPQELFEIENLFSAAFNHEIPSIVKASHGRFAATVFFCYQTAGLSVSDFRSDLNAIINEDRSLVDKNPSGWRQYVATRISNQAKAVLSAARAIS